VAETEVLEWLANQRLGGNDGFFTLKNIYAGVGYKNRGNSYIAKQVKRLYLFGFVEIFHEQVGSFRPFKYWYRASLKGMKAVQVWSNGKGKEKNSVK